MQCRKSSLLAFLETEQSLIVPVYQRHYAWTSAEVQELFSDIIQVAIERRGSDKKWEHFVGSLVYVEVDDANANTQRVLVDGQQRVTTLSLLLLALATHVKDPLVRKQIQERYLLLSDKVTPKLFPVRDDRISYRQICVAAAGACTNDAMGSAGIDNSASIPKSYGYSQIADSYRLLCQLVKTADSINRQYRDNKNTVVAEDVDSLGDAVSRMGLNRRVSPTEILDALQWLTIAEISLDPELRSDNPQIVFESINAKGSPLSETDKIRNYLLMNNNLERQEYLFEHYWCPIEDRCRDEFGDDKVAHFVRYFLNWYVAPRCAVRSMGQVFLQFRRWVDARVDNTGHMNRMIEQIWQPMIDASLRYEYLFLD